MSLRGWVVALSLFIACLFLVNRELFPKAPGDQDQKLNSEESANPTIAAAPTQDGSRWFPGL